MLAKQEKHFTAQVGLVINLLGGKKSSRRAERKGGRGGGVEHAGSGASSAVKGAQNMCIVLVRGRSLDRARHMNNDRLICKAT